MSWSASEQKTLSDFALVLVADSRYRKLDSTGKAGTRQHHPGQGRDRRDDISPLAAATR